MKNEETASTAPAQEGKHLKTETSTSLPGLRLEGPGKLLAAALLGAWLTITPVHAVTDPRARRRDDLLADSSTASVDVDPTVDLASHCRLLGRHVGVRSHGASDGRPFLLFGFAQTQAGQAQIKDFHETCCGQHQVGRLDIAMNERLMVDVVQPHGSLAR